VEILADKALVEPQIAGRPQSPGLGDRSHQLPGVEPGIDRPVPENDQDKKPQAKAQAEKKSVFEPQRAESGRPPGKALRRRGTGAPPYDSQNAVLEFRTRRRSLGAAQELLGGPQAFV
jgi:hypothetical protein